MRGCISKPAIVNYNLLVRNSAAKIYLHVPMCSLMPLLGKTEDGEKWLMVSRSVELQLQHSTPTHPDSGTGPGFGTPTIETLQPVREHFSCHIITGFDSKSFYAQDT